MPGLNQKGPMNEGAMTGRGLGRCTNPNVNTFGAQDTAGNGQGIGRGQGGLGQGCGRGIGRGRGQRNWSAAVPAAATQMSQQVQPAEDEALKLRVHQLESELEAIKNQMTQVDNQ